MCFDVCGVFVVVDLFCLGAVCFVKEWSGCVRCNNLFPICDMCQMSSVHIVAMCSDEWNILCELCSIVFSSDLDNVE